MYNDSYLFGFKCDGIRDYETEVDEFYWDDDDQYRRNYSPPISVIEPCGWKFMLTEPVKWAGHTEADYK